MPKPRQSGPSSPPSFLSCASLARELDLSESTVRDLVEKGSLPRPIRLGGSIRWRWSEVQAVLTGAAAVPQRTTDDPYLAGAVYATKES